MKWFRKKQAADAPVIPFGTLRIAKVWTGGYVIQEFGARLMPGYHLLKGWWTIEDAGNFDTEQAAFDRIRFMGKFDMLITGPAA